MNVVSNEIIPTMFEIHDVVLQWIIGLFCDNSNRINRSSLSTIFNRDYFFIHFHVSFVLLLCIVISGYK